MKISLALYLAILVFGNAGQCLAYPKLEVSTLFSSIAQSCHDVPLQGWNHPTRKILEQSKVGLLKLQLCNGDHYPVYTVRFPYDPQGHTDAFFRPFYGKMARANGFWPLAFVDISDNEIVWIQSKPGVPDISLNYEQFSP